MEYQVLSNIVIRQMKSAEFPNRDLVITIPQLVRYEADSSWAHLTTTLNISIPKGILVTVQSDSNPSINGRTALANIIGQTSNIGGFTVGTVPVFLRGDMISFNVGYRGVMNGAQYTYVTGGPQVNNDGTTTPALIPPLFEGFIAGVTGRLVFELKCEDYMFLLKQVPTPSKQWGNQTIQSIVQTVINDNLNYQGKDSNDLSILQKYSPFGVNLTVSDFSTTTLTFNVKNFITQRGSLADLLARIKHQYRQDSWFRGQELRIGLLHYVPDDMRTNTFTFQQNIIENRLTWRRRDDVNISLLIKCHYTVNLDAYNDDGTQKTRMKCKEVLIYNTGGKDGVFTYTEKIKGVEFGENLIGERFDFPIFSDDPRCQNADYLFQLGVAEIKKRYYDGFRGSFTIFGIPYVKHGDMVNLVDNILPERNGSYMVKRVTYSGGAEAGLRQEIFLDYLIPEP